MTRFCWRPWRARKRVRWTSTLAVESSSSVLRGRGRASRRIPQIVLFRKGEPAVFVYGFAKSERANINADEAKRFKEAAQHGLRLTERARRLGNAGRFCGGETT